MLLSSTCPATVAVPLFACHRFLCTCAPLTMPPLTHTAVQVKAAAAGKKGVIFFCEAGGTMRPSSSFPLGKASRSLQACYRALSEELAGQVWLL